MTAEIKLGHFWANDEIAKEVRSAHQSWLDAKQRYDQATDACHRDEAYEVLRMELADLVNAPGNEPPKRTVGLSKKEIAAREKLVIKAMKAMPIEMARKAAENEWCKAEQHYHATWFGHYSDTAKSH